MTITPKVYRKTVKSKTVEVEVIQKRQKGQKQRKSKKIVVEADHDEEETTYNYLDCCIYTIENLTDEKLDTDMLPLFAIMLGNDFISRKWFAKFFRNVSKRNSKKKKGLSPQQKKIHILLNWLQHETLRSAVKKILDCVKSSHRTKLWFQIRNAMRGYRMVYSKSFEYFGFEETADEIEDGNILDMNIDELMASDDDDDDENHEEAENDESDGDGDDSDVEPEISGEEIANSDEEQHEPEENELEADGFEAKNSEDEDFKEEPLSDEEPEPEWLRRKKFVFPDWFKDIYNSGRVPRFLVDIFRCHRYINYPQVEDFNGKDSNSISYPILNLLYALLHSPDIRPLYYYTRVPKQVRYEVKKVEPDFFPTVTDYDPNQKKNFKFIKMIFEKDFRNVDEIFESIKTIPEAHQLYILSVIFWIKRSSSTDSAFLQSVIVGLLAISVVDRKCEKIHRDGPKFLKNFEKNLKEFEANESLSSEDSFNDIPIMSIIKNITKHEALLTMKNLIHHYSISPKFTRKHADFRRNVVHTFSELQSVAFNLYSIDPFLNYPFENIKIENYFNGLFLYNMYLNLKSRANPLEYIRSFIFNHSPALMVTFQRIYDICLSALPELKTEVPSVEPEPVGRKLRSKTLKKPTKPVQKNDCATRQNESDDEFVDMNNKFSELLLSKN